MTLLAATAILPAGATIYFFVFWTWFETWRRHRIATYAMMFGTFVALGTAVYLLRDMVFAHRVDVPVVVQAIGWVVVAVATAVGFWADRQIGFRVRSFTPFFERGERIRLVTNGAYGIVRHPIYAAGIAYQIGVLLVTGYPAVGVACVVFAGGAAWFTRQEERRLVELLDDPTDYERYRARVPALLPWPGRSRRRRS